VINNTTAAGCRPVLQCRRLLYMDIGSIQRVIHTFLKATCQMVHMSISSSIVCLKSNALQNHYQMHFNRKSLFLKILINQAIQMRGTYE